MLTRFRLNLGCSAGAKCRHAIISVSTPNEKWKRCMWFGERTILACSLLGEDSMNESWTLSGLGLTNIADNLLRVVGSPTPALIVRTHNMLDWPDVYIKYTPFIQCIREYNLYGRLHRRTMRGSQTEGGKRANLRWRIESSPVFRERMLLACVCSLEEHFLHYSNHSHCSTHRNWLRIN